MELTDEEFGNLVKSGKINKLSDNIELALIANGIKLSPDIEAESNDYLKVTESLTT